MTQNEFITQLANARNCQLKEAKAFLDDLGSVITDALAAGEEVPLPGLGKLVVKDKAPRQGRNPRTGEAVTIAAKRVVAFKPSGALASAVGGE